MPVQKVCARHGRIGCECGKRDARPSASARGYGAKHRRDRKVFLEANPICSEPGCPEQATDLDHIDGNPNNRDPRNYRGLCHKHHSQRTARDQPGGWLAGL